MAITTGDLISHLGTNPLMLDGAPAYIRVGRTELPVVAIEVRTGPDGKPVQVTLIGGFDLPLAKLEDVMPVSDRTADQLAVEDD